MPLNGLNIDFPIKKANGDSFHGLVLHKATYDSTVMSLDDKISGDVYYQDNTLSCNMDEFVEYNGVKFTIVNPPTIVREGLVKDNSDAKGLTKYSFEFYHPMYMLANMPFNDVAVSYDENKYKSQDNTFSWVGKLPDFAAKLAKNLQNTVWAVEVAGTDVISPSKLDELSDVLSFDKNTIADALKTAYDTWKVPFIIDTIATTDARYQQGKKYLIRFGLPSNEIYENDEAKQAGVPFVFQFGQGVGLKNNSATPKNNKIVTRLAGYGAERNVPFGYPQIKWTGNQDWEYTINNDSTAEHSYPIYKGIVNGEWVKLIKHPFTRKRLMPTIYVEKVNKKVDPNNAEYDPDIEIIDYYDATDGTVYPNTINLLAPSYEIHEFDDIYPRLGEQEVSDAYPIKDNTKERDTDWDDTATDEGEYVQGYFKITLPILDFDLYACAAITEQMQINMRSGACIGCTFDVQVDWDDYKKKFYDSDGNFVPQGSQRDFDVYPDSSQKQITIIVKKDTDTFGTMLPNKFQNPKDGDKFVILGISLPLRYITNAQYELDEAMREYMLENNVYYFEYPLKFDEYFLAQHTYILQQIKGNSVVRFEFAGETISLYVKQISIKYNNTPLPEYDITLTDDVDIVINKIGQTTEDLSKMRVQVSALQTYLNKTYIEELNNKLSRSVDDVARGKITFSRGFDVGNFIAGSSGASMTIGGDDSTSLELDFLTVRRAAKFREITIQELKHIGGELALTAAAMVCSKVEQASGGYKCYFETTDGERTVYQEFVVGDQARCQQFQLIDVDGVHEATKYYWRVVTEVGSDYIVLSNEQGLHDGDGVPAVGDKIVQLGYRKELNDDNDIPYRTTAIILSATSDDAPSAKYYEGITSFSLSNVVKDDGYSDGRFHSNTYGSAYIGAKDRSSYIEYTPENGIRVNAVLNVGSQLADGTNVNALMTGDINLLLNSGFTGDYQSIDVSTTSTFDGETVVYSPSFKYWDYNTGCLTRQSNESASGYECYMGSIGRLSQAISNIKETTYVVSVKAFNEGGGNLTMSFGGVENTYELDETPRYFAFKVVNPINGVFALSTSTGCVVCEPMVSEGNVFDAWSMSPMDNDKAMGEYYAYSYLMNALAQASTTINKGLVLTQLIKVGNYRNGSMVQETGGMNGLVTDSDGTTDPFIWGGGTMDAALYTIMKYKDDPSYQATQQEIAQMAKFVVTHGGRAILNDIVLRGYIYAEGGVFNGIVYASGGSFKGSIEATGGKIGGMTVTQSGIGISGVDITGSDSYTYLTDGTFEYTRKYNNVVAATVKVGQDTVIDDNNNYRNPVLSINVNDTVTSSPTALSVSCVGTQGDAAAIRIGRGFVQGFKLPFVWYSRVNVNSYNVVDGSCIVLRTADGSNVLLDGDAETGSLVFIKSLDTGDFNINATTQNSSTVTLEQCVGEKSTDLRIYLKTPDDGWVKLL